MEAVAEALEVAPFTIGKFEFEGNRVVATEDMTVEEWGETLAWAKHAHRASPFWVGDLLAFGEVTFPETYSQFLDAVDYESGTADNLAWVARAIPPSRRRESLPFAIHQEVAPLEPDQQDAWLDKAEAEHLTRDQVRAQIKETKKIAKGETTACWLSVSCVDAADQQALADRLKLEGRNVKLK